MLRTLARPFQGRLGDFHGEMCYALLRDHNSNTLYSAALCSKAPPIEWSHRVASQRKRIHALHTVSGKGILCLCQLPSLCLRTHTLTSICSEQFFRFVETNWMVPALMSWSITSVMKLHPTNRPLVPSPDATSGSFLFGISGSPRWEQLDAQQKQNIFSIPCPAPPGATVLRSQLRFAETHASCIDQPCMHFFFALSTTISFVVIGADCNYTCANALSPS
jgi:hypothetical protein